MSLTRVTQQARGTLPIAALLAGLLVLAGWHMLPIAAQEPGPASRIQAMPSTVPGIPQTGLPLAQVWIHQQPYTVEVTRTPQQARYGLMFRTGLPERHGMLFSFHPARPVHFWMKNTLIPLDMIFIHQNRVVHILHQVPPCLAEPCPSYPSRFAVDTVVELPAGTAQRDQLAIGAEVALQPVAHPPAAAFTPAQEAASSSSPSDAGEAPTVLLPLVPDPARVEPR